MRTALVLVALAAPFLFPYPATLLLSFAASLFFPPTAFLAGALAELSYYAPGAGLPVALLSGALLSLAALAARRFARGHVYAGS